MEKPRFKAEYSPSPFDENDPPWAVLEEYKGQWGVVYRYETEAEAQAEAEELERVQPR